MGFYGGVAVPPELVSGYLPFVIGPKDGGYVLDGDNIFSMINTIFEYDSHGKPIRQAAEGYNCELRAFAVEGRFPSETGEIKNPASIKSTYLYCIFATGNIPATATGTELRMDYRFNEEAINTIFGQKQWRQRGI